MATGRKSVSMAAGVSDGSVSPRDRDHNGHRRGSSHLHLKDLLNDSVEASSEELDRLLLKLEFGVNQLLAAGDSAVKRPKAELNLAVNCDKMRDLIDQAMAVKDERKVFKECFADCQRVIRVELLLEQVGFEVCKDERRLTVLRKTGDVQTVLRDLGFAEQLDAILEMAKKKGLAFQTEDDSMFEGPNAEALPELANALVVGSVAVELEEQGKITDAITEYKKAKVSLGVAIKVIGAVVKLRKSIGGQASSQADGLKLTQYQLQVQQRIDYLETVPEGQRPEVPVEEQIQPPELDMLRDRNWLSRLLLYAGAAGAALGGIVLGGPFFGLLVGATAGTGAFLIDQQQEKEQQEAAEAAKEEPSS